MYKFSSESSSKVMWTRVKIFVRVFAEKYAIWNLDSIVLCEIPGDKFATLNTSIPIEMLTIQAQKSVLVPNSRKNAWYFKIMWHLYQK